MQALLQEVFSSRQDDTEYLEEIVEKFPFFTLAHIALLQKINKNDRSHLRQLTKTALHVNNTHLLNFLLEDKAASNLTEIYTEATSGAQESLTPVGTTSESGQEFYTPGEKLKKVDTEEEAPLFEPLYTTDYFASQGIKLSEELKTNDKLGRQLKSFTEWLKTMKKVHPSQKMEAVIIDTTVEKLAEKSNLEADIITEAMAEVYESQGKYKKAKEIYQKLSLLNPAKSAFFAAKSEQIKDH